MKTFVSLGTSMLHVGRNRSSYK